MKAAIYTRVSSEMQTGGDHFSLEGQMRACREFCDRKDWQVVAEYVEEGKSARKDNLRNRPKFRQMLADAEAHQFNVIVFHKLDRFSRSMKVTFNALDRLEAVGVKIHAVTQNIERITAHDRAFFNMTTVWAELFSDLLSEETKKGKAERKAQGIYNGCLPYGLRKNAEKQVESDPDRWPRLVEMFELAAAGKTDAEIAATLNAKGYRMEGRLGVNLWRKDTVRRVLVNRFYLGELPIIQYRPDRKKGVRMGWQQGKHNAFIDADLFERAQATRDNNRKSRATKVNGKSTVYPLSGLLWCGYCGFKVRVARDWNGKAYARCYGKTQGLECQHKARPIELIERQIERWLETLIVPDDAIERALFEIMRADRQTDGEKERRQLQGQLDRLKSLWLWGDIEEGEYLRQRSELQGKLRALQPVERQRRDIRELAEHLRNVPHAYAATFRENRNSILQRVIEKVIIKDDQVVEIVPRPDVQMLL